MRIAYLNNAKLEAEILDGTLLMFHNLSDDRTLNLAGNDPLKGGRLAIVFDVDDDSASPSIDFDGPGDISRNAIDVKG